MLQVLARSYLLALLTVAVPATEQTTLFHDDFKGTLADGWRWVRETPEAWRVTDRGLEIRVLPGNMWGPANDARNVLVRPIAVPSHGTVEVSVTVTNTPGNQYEQTNLVWYYDDGHMVKIGQEQVDGVLSLVMGREERDAARTIAIIPIKAQSIDVRLLVTGNDLRGEFRPAGSTGAVDGGWIEAGRCTLPAKGEPKISLQAYQGAPGVEHWARFSDFRIVERAR